MSNLISKYELCCGYELYEKKEAEGKFIDCTSSISNRATWYANNCEICSKVDNGCPYYGQPYTEHEPLYCSGLNINKLKENIDNGNDDC